MTDLVCEFRGCGRVVEAKGLCVGHYNQRRYGKPLKPLQLRGQNKTCSFPSCDKPLCAKGLCSSHWAQQNRGQELTVLQNMVTLKDRILRSTRQTEYCWIWEGRVSGKRSYPQISVKGRQKMVHRLSYEEFVRPLKDGETVDHLCRNVLCVRPEHLEAVPLRENVKRMHAYRSLLAENKRLREFITSMGHDPDQV